MAIHVSMGQPEGAGSLNNLSAGNARAYQAVAIDTVSTIVAADGEWAMVLNNEGSACIGAKGTTPDATAQSATAATSAGFPVPHGVIVPVRLKAGDKLKFTAAA